MATHYRSLINKIFTRKYQFALQADALTLLEEILDEHASQEEDADEHASTICEVLAKECQQQDDCGTIITKAILQRVYEVMSSAAAGDDPLANALDGDMIDPEHHLYVIDAFEMPSWNYSVERKTFEKSLTAPSVAGSASARAHMMRNRHNVIKQLVLRNENFSPPMSGRDRPNYLKITSSKNLLGRAGERFMLFGMLSHMPDGRLCVEDTDGRVILDISNTSPSEGLFTEGCFVLVEGDYTDDETLTVLAIGHPPCEQRSVTRSIYGHIDMLGKGSSTLLEDQKFASHLKSYHSSLAFLVLSDLWLDHPRTLHGLRQVLEGCIENDFIPLVFILCGNFASRDLDLMGGVGIQRYQDNFDALCTLLQSFPAIVSTSHFVFVPGPTDPWSTASSPLPRSPLPASLTARIKARIPKAHFASNPCRIKFCGQEIVVFREDLMARMIRNLVGVKRELGGRDLKRYLVQTILDQAHLSPLPISIQPVLWEYDHAMRLYPMPTTLILADKFERYELTYEGCHVFNPGNFVGNDFGFSTYLPATGRSEASSIGMEVEE